MKLFYIYFFDDKEDLDDEIIDDEKRENYDFKTTAKPPPVKDIDFENFEKDLFKIPEQLVYRNIKRSGRFQTKLKEDLEDMNKTENVINQGTFIHGM